jgi:hypothetical protein
MQSNRAQATAIAAALGATVVTVVMAGGSTASETYVLSLKENRRAHLTLQFGKPRQPERLFIDAVYPHDVFRDGRRVSRHYRVVSEIRELGIGEELHTSSAGNPTQIAADIERHLVRDYLKVLDKVLPFFPELTAPVAAQSAMNPAVGHLTT